MKYLLKLIFDEQEMIYNENTDIMKLMDELGIKDIITRANTKAIESNDVDRKSVWVEYTKREFKNLAKYKFNLNITGNNHGSLKLINIVPKFSRYEGKIFLILILNRMKSLDEVNFSEEELYSIRETFKEKLEDCHIDLLIKYKSIEGNEYLTVSNPVPVFNHNEIKHINNIVDESYNEFEDKQYKRFDKTKYLDANHRLKYLRSNENYVRIYTLFYLLKDLKEDSEEKVVDDFHTLILSFVRTKSFEERLKSEFLVIDKLGRLNKVIEYIWPKIKIELSKISIKNSIFPNSEVKIFLHMIELSSNLHAVIYSVDSKFQDYTLRYEERFERIEFNLNKSQKEHYRESLKENVYKYFNNAKMKLEIAKSSITSFQDLRADIDSQANFKLQIFMLILTIVLTLWGIFTLIYDKAINITAIIEGILPSARILVSIVLLFGILSLFIYFIVKKRMYSHIDKTIYNHIDYCTCKCSINNECSLNLENIWNIKKINSMKTSKKILKKLEILNFISILLLNYGCNYDCDSTIDKLICMLKDIEI